MTFLHCISLLSVLLVIQARVLIEQELLYSKVGNAEYLFIPNTPSAINRLPDARGIGMSKTQKLRNEMKSMRKGGYDGNVDVTDFIKFHQDADFVRNITHPKILRLEDGITMEFDAKWDPKSRCFEDVELAPLEDSDEASGRSEPASLQVQEDLDKICATGFSALEPSSKFLISNNHYVGSRMEVIIDLEFKNSKVKSVGVAGDRTGVAYQPICSGIFAVAETPLTIVILRKAKQRVFGRLFSSIAPVERYLCDKRHERRQLTWSQLNLWNHDLPDSFKIPTVSKIQQDLDSQG